MRRTSRIDVMFTRDSRCLIYLLVLATGRNIQEQHAFATLTAAREMEKAWLNG